MSKLDIVEDTIADHLILAPFYKHEAALEEPKGFANLGNTCFLNSSL